MSTFTTSNVTVAMGRAGDSYYMVVRFTDQLVRMDLTAEQYARLVTGESVTVQGEVKAS